MKRGCDDFDVRMWCRQYCCSHADVVSTQLEAFVQSRQMAVLSSVSLDMSLAAGESTPTSTPQSPQEEVVFTFASEGSEDKPEAWKATLTVPPCALAQTPLTLSVVDAHGQLMEGGSFSLAGAVLPLVNGTAEIPFGLFLAGMKNASVAYLPVKGKPVKGTLAFFV